MIDKILDFIKHLFSIYWKTRPFRAFIALNTLVLVGFSAFKMTYSVTSGKHAWGIEVTQGEYNWIVVIILATINIPFVIWLINDLLKAKLELLHEVKVGYFFEGNVEVLSPTFEEKIISYKLKEQPKSSVNNSLLGLSSLQLAIADFQNLNRNVVKATSVHIIRGEINKSFYPIQFYLENTGKPSLKSFEIIFYFGNDVAAIKHSNKETRGIDLSLMTPSSTYIDEKRKYVCLKGGNKMLVGGNNIATKAVFVKPVYPNEKIIVRWKLLADEFQQTGEMEIPVFYDFVTSSINREVSDIEALKEDEVTIGDFIEPIY